MNQERLMRVLLSPQITEKTAMAADRNRQYAFRVIADASKPEIKSAVEMLFDVKVDGVQVVNVKGKRKNFGRIPGRRSDWKKAYVTLADGYDINFVDAG